MTTSTTEETQAVESSVLSTGQSYDWIPEKFHVRKDDGGFDIEASARKIADAHRHLEQRLGSGDVPPKTPEAYEPKVEAEGFNWEEFKEDPEMKGFLKAAHSKGITNDQMSFLLSEYMRRVPELIAGSNQMDAEQATAELSKEWKTDEEFQRNVNLAFKAFNAFAAEADLERIDEIGNNPIVIRLLANIGKEMAEDVPVEGAHTHEADFDTKVAELREQLTKLPQSDPRRKQIKAEYDALYNRRYGTKPHRLGGGTSRQSSF